MRRVTTRPHIGRTCETPLSLFYERLHRHVCIRRTRVCLLLLPVTGGWSGEYGERIKMFVTRNYYYDYYGNSSTQHYVYTRHATENSELKLFIYIRHCDVSDISSVDFRL